MKSTTKKLMGSAALAGVLLAGAFGGSSAAMAKGGLDDGLEPGDDHGVHAPGHVDPGEVLAKHGADDLIPEAPHLEGADDGVFLAKHGADDLIPEAPHLEGADDGVVVLAKHGADDLFPEAPHLEGADDFLI
jgi:hypothetical protein